MDQNYLNVNNLKVSSVLLEFVNNELLSDTGITPEKFWSGFDKSVHELAPKNIELIKIREELQKLMNYILKIKVMKLNLIIIKNF